MQNTAVVALCLASSMVVGCETWSICEVNPAAPECCMAPDCCLNDEACSTGHRCDSPCGPSECSGPEDCADGCGGVCEPCLDECSASTGCPQGEVCVAGDLCNRCVPAATEPGCADECVSDEDCGGPCVVLHGGMCNVCLPPPQSGEAGCQDDTGCSNGEACSSWSLFVERNSCYARAQEPSIHEGECPTTPCADGGVCTLVGDHSPNRCEPPPLPPR
jgi:hypothetical protein